MGPSLALLNGWSWDLQQSPIWPRTVQPHERIGVHLRLSAVPFFFARHMPIEKMEPPINADERR
jgi:hypothetical protein